MSAKPSKTAYPPAGERITVSVETMAATMGISRYHAYSLLRSGVIESRYLGRRRLVSWPSLCEFMDSLPTEREA